MYTGGGRNLELGANSIGARYQHGFFPTLGVEGEKGAKRSDAAEDAAREGARSDAADAVLGLLGSGNVYSCINVAHAGTALSLPGLGARQPAVQTRLFPGQSSSL